MVLSNETPHQLALMSLGVACLGAPSPAHPAVFSQEHWELPGSSLLAYPHPTIAWLIPAKPSRQGSRQGSQKEPWEFFTEASNDCALAENKWFELLLHFQVFYCTAELICPL